MKKRFKIKSVLALFTILSIASCSSDDASPQTPSITLQDLEVTIDENPTNGAVIGTVQSNSTTALTFSIVSQTPSGALEIDASTGELTIIDAALFDFETNPTITATVSASGAQNQALITINLNNIAEVNVQNFNSTIYENPTNAQSLGTVNASGDASLTFSIVSQTPSGAISINTTTGELTVLNASLFDYETNPTITATVQVDNSGTTENLAVTIDLQDKHEVGEYKFGGVIFWVNTTGDEGYVVSLTNQANNASWGCVGTNTGATGTNIGDGVSNSSYIFNSGCSIPGSAVDYAINLNSNGFDDWFTPSTNSLVEIYNNSSVIESTIIASGGQALLSSYWSSTEVDSYNAHLVTSSGSSLVVNKATASFGARAVRHWTDF